VQDDASRAAAKEAGLPWIRGGLVEHAGGGHLIMEAHYTPWGRQHVGTMRDSVMGDRMWAFIMQGEDLPYATNTVDLSPSVKDARGLPVARVTYQPGRHELAASKHHGKILQGVLEEMGSEWVIHTSSPGVSYTGLGSTPVPESRHVIGTARMGDDPASAVVDRWSRVHQFDNLIIADSSVFPTASGYGPTLTLVALAARAAHHLAGTAPSS
jgi:choline dehydrogenase-like flavoprotein